MTSPDPGFFEQLAKLVESSSGLLTAVLSGLATLLVVRSRDERNNRRLAAKLELDLAAERYRLSPREQALQEALDKANQEHLAYLERECTERDDQIATLQKEVRDLAEENRRLWLKAAQYKAALTGGDDEPTGFQRPD